MTFSIDKAVEKAAHELHELHCMDSMNGLECRCLRFPEDADHFQAFVAIMTVLPDFRASIIEEVNAQILNWWRADRANQEKDNA